MKHLLIIQATLIILNTTLKVPANWWLICSPFLAYTAFEVVLYIRVELRAKKERKKKEAKLIERHTYRIKKIQEQINKNLN